jgi:hypothetical protein
MTADLPSSVFAVCRPVMICWTVVINVTILPSVLSFIGLLLSCMLLAMGIAWSFQHAVCCSCGEGFPWRNSSRSEAAIKGRLRADMMLLSPLELFFGAAAPSVVAGMLRLTVEALR